MSSQDREPVLGWSQSVECLGRITSFPLRDTPRNVLIESPDLIFERDVQDDDSPTLKGKVDTS